MIHTQLVRWKKVKDLVVLVRIELRERNDKRFGPFQNRVERYTDRGRGELQSKVYPRRTTEGDLSFEVMTESDHVIGVGDFGTNRASSTSYL